MPLSETQDIRSMISNARLLVKLCLDDPAFTATALQFTEQLNANPDILTQVLRFSPLPQPGNDGPSRENPPKIRYDDEQRAATMLQWVIESAVYILIIHDTQGPEIVRLAYIDSLVQQHPNNSLLKNAYTKVVQAFHTSFNESFAIRTRAANETLTPVLLYLPRVRQRHRLDARLSFISVTADDYAKKIFLPVPLSPAEEIPLLKIFFDFLKVYPEFNSWSTPLVNELLKIADGIIRDMPAQNKAFLKERFEKICDEPAEQNSYWMMFENTSYLKTLESYLHDYLDDAERKAVVDFSLFVIALAIWYGKGPLWQKTVQRKVERLRLQYPKDSFADKMALFVLTIDFAFTRKDAETPAATDEHLTLLQTMRSINPDTAVQALNGTQTWVRDSFAWLDETYRVMLHTEPAKNVRGLLSEGGSIVAGSAITPFALVSREVAGGDVTIANLFVVAKKFGVSIYTLPGAFSWARNFRTMEDVVLESTHIDTVINIVPADCTNDNRLKILVDPYYYLQIENFFGFKRFVQEQRIQNEDIIRIHPEEVYLNLANFSIILDPQGKKKLLFNKDKKLTLPRLNLKSGIVVQPAIEIVNISAFSGNIRCVSNMFPREHIRSAESLSIILQNSLPKQTEETIISFFAREESLIRALLRYWVTKVVIRSRFKQSSYYFDPLSRQISISLDYEDSFDSESACRYLEYSIRSLCARFSRDMGIPAQQQPDVTTEISLTIKNLVPQEQTAPERTQGKVLQFDSRVLAV